MRIPTNRALATTTPLGLLLATALSTAISATALSATASPATAATPSTLAPAAATTTPTLQQHAHDPEHAAAHQGVHHEGLGRLSFPTSGTAEAQADFERGVLFMHSFEYEQAAAAFRAAQERDPDFAMAYWGEAMTHNHPVWNEQDREAALAVLARYAPTPAERAARAPTDRERGYLEAVDVLYGAGTKAERDTLYARAMQALAEAHPDDDEARAFHALAVLGESRGDRDVPSYMRAGAIALDVFQRNPEHPGGAHYVIHAFDDPTHAPLGLAAAEAYADIAPAAAHAQHMTTHIFLALGMWDRVVASNIRADAVVDEGRAAEGREATDCGHYNQWLAYGYHMQGRQADAEALVAGCLHEADAAPMLSIGAESMRAMYVAALDEAAGPLTQVGLEAVSDRPAAASPATTASDQSATALPATTASDLSTGASPAENVYAVLRDWTAGFAAARRGEVDAARGHLHALEARLDGERTELTPLLAPYAPIWRGTLRAVVAAAEGDLPGAVDAAQAAAEAEAALPVDFGPPLSFKPARELEAELLLRADRPAEALAAFRLALARTPMRAPALKGFAAAAEAAGEPDLARSARAQLAEITVH